MGPRELPISCLEKICTAYEKLFSDLWFSSLWALQEVILRRDAKILGSSGEPVKWDDHYSAFIGMIMNVSQNIYDDLNRVRKAIDAMKKKKKKHSQLILDQCRADDQVIRLTNLIIRSGFYHYMGITPIFSMELPNTDKIPEAWTVSMLSCRFMD